MQSTVSDGYVFTVHRPSNRVSEEPTSTDGYGYGCSTGYVTSNLDGLTNHIISDSTSLENLLDDTEASVPQPFLI